MAMRLIGCSGNVHRGSVLSGIAAAPFHCHRSFFPIKRATFFAPQKISSISFSNTKRRRSRVIECSFRAHLDRVEEVEVGSSGLEDFLVISFYKFVFIKDPEAEVSKHLDFLREHDIHGRIYVNEQGINAQYSGPTKDALAYAEWLKDDPRFSDMLVQTSPALNGHAFPRLKLRYKPSLVQFEGGTLHLPLLDPSMRATPLAPSEWRKRLENDGSVINRNFLLLDVRNGYEWDVGHFQGARRPNVDCFRGTSFGLCNQEVRHGWFGRISALQTLAPVPNLDPLAGIDKQHTDILMYCTGGIRCDVYSTILRERGFENLYTLSGGVSHYLQSEGSAKWIGNLFVFDSRLSLPPSTYKSGESAEKRCETGCQNEESREMGYQNATFARCYVCSSQLREFRHRNCANLDCNRLFLCCAACIQKLRGCCCMDCTRSPRLRPVLPGNQRYQKWHLYRDEVFQQQA